MSKNEYFKKIDLLELLSVGIWIKKDRRNKKVNKYCKTIVVLEDMNNKHKDIVENFINAAKEFYNGIKVDFLDQKDIISLKDFESEHKEKNIFLILCDKETKSELTDKLSFNEDFYVNNVKNNIFLFNTLLSSEKVTNNIKKSIWNNFIYIANYE